MLRLYGLKNCSTCIKAQQWLKTQGIAFEFSDYRAEPIAPDRIQQWAEKLTWAKLVNKSSTSWRALSDEEKQANTPEQWLALVDQHPTLMKRPIMVNQDRLLLGFKPETYSDFLA